MDPSPSVRRVVFLAAFFISLGAIAHAQVPTSLAVVPTREQAALEKIEAALLKRVSLEYSESPLHDVLEAVAEQAKIPIVLTKKIEDAGVKRDTPVSIRLKEVSLESGLRRLLADVNLTFLIKDETLLITTVEDAHSPENLITRVYPVADLARAPDGTYDFDPLCDLIQSSIEPDSWGDGNQYIPNVSNPPALVISQRREIHQRIEALLLTLRRVRDLQGPVPAITKPAGQAGQSTPAPKASVPFGVPEE